MSVFHSCWIPHEFHLLIIVPPNTEYGTVSVKYKRQVATIWTCSILGFHSQIHLSLHLQFQDIKKASGSSRLQDGSHQPMSDFTHFIHTLWVSEKAPIARLNVTTHSAKRNTLTQNSEFIDVIFLFWLLRVLWYNESHDNPQGFIVTESRSPPEIPGAVDANFSKGPTREKESLTVFFRNFSAETSSLTEFSDIIIQD